MTDRHPLLLAAVFDLDDTLYPERDYVRSGYRAVAAHLRDTLGTDDAYEEWLWRRFESGESARALDAMNGRFGLGLDEGQIRELVAVYREHRPDIRPHAGAARVLDALQGRAKLGLLSDGFLPAQRLKLEALGLAGRFHAVVFTESLAPAHAAWKPSPAGFMAISVALAALPEVCVYVADNPAKDFLAPNRLGWRTVRILLAGQVHRDAAPPDGGAAQVCVESWEELGALLAGFG